MKIGDRFFTVAYTENTRVIEAEVIDVENLENEEYIYFRNVEHTLDQWFKPANFVERWKFETREDAEKKLKEC